MFNKHEHRVETEVRNTFRLLKWDHVSQQTFETMIGDVTDNFTDTTPPANQKGSKKNKLRPVTVSHSRKVNLPVMSLQIRHFAAQCLRGSHSEQGKNEQYTTHTV